MRLGVSVSVLLALGCGGQSQSQEHDGSERGGTGSSVGGAGTRGGSAGTSGGRGGSSGTGTGGASIDGGGSAGEGDVCATATIDVGRPIRNFFFVVDRSETLAGDRWTNIVETLVYAFSSPDLAYTGIALGIFPDMALPPSCNDVTCSAEGCGNPLVGLGELTAESRPADLQEDLLLRMLSDLTPDGENPPLAPALDAALSLAESRKSEQPGAEHNVVLLATGDTNACGDFGADRVRQAYLDLGISTLVVGFDDGNRALLDEIAIYGGTDQMLALGAEPEVNAADIVQLLSPGSVDIGCDFPLPEQPSSGILDLTDVTLEFAQNGVPYPVEEVSGPGACLDGPGWYFDDGTNPTRVYLCPRTCADAASGSFETLQIWIGCSRINP